MFYIATSYNRTAKGKVTKNGRKDLKASLEAECDPRLPTWLQNTPLDLKQPRRPYITQFLLLSFSLVVVVT